MGKIGEYITAFEYLRQRQVSGFITDFYLFNDLIKFFPFRHLYTFPHCVKRIKL